MSAKVVDVVRRVEYITQDDGTRATRLEIQEWLNEAYITIVLARPDANALTGTFTCAAGARQDITTGFATAFRVLDVVRNLAAGSTKRVIRLVDRRSLDNQLPTWTAETGTEDIQNWMFDPKQPKQFMVYPPALVTTQVEVVYSAPVGSHALLEAALAPDSGDVTEILLDDIYLAPLVDWILYRLYSKDAHDPVNAARAAAHLQAFTVTLNAKTSVDSAATPQ